LFIASQIQLKNIILSLFKFLVFDAIYSLVLSSHFEGEYQNILSSFKLSAIIFFTNSGIFSHFATGSQIFSQEI
jgi:hypothetical protein